MSKCSQLPLPLQAKAICKTLLFLFSYNHQKISNLPKDISEPNIRASSLTDITVSMRLNAGKMNTCIIRKAKTFSKRPNSVEKTLLKLDNVEKITGIGLGGICTVFPEVVG